MGWTKQEIYFLYQELKETSDARGKALRRVWQLSDLLDDQVVAQQIREAIVGDLLPDIVDRNTVVYVEESANDGAVERESESDE